MDGPFLWLFFKCMKELNITSNLLIFLQQYLTVILQKKEQKCKCKTRFDNLLKLLGCHESEKPENAKKKT